MSEKIFDDGAVQVSASIVRIGGETFSVPNITSVRAEHPRLGNQLGGAVIFGICALLALPSGSYVWAVVFVGLAVASFMGRSRLFLSTAGGERKALTASATYCRQVREAIIQAMEASSKRA